MLENIISNGSHPQPVALPPILAFIMGVPVAPREAVERTIERAIEALDLIDGDPDLEDATDLEDDFSLTWIAQGQGGPGCQISDTDEENGDREGIDEREEIDEREPEEGDHGMQYGVDQSREIGPDNPVLL